MINNENLQVAISDDELETMGVTGGAGWANIGNGFTPQWIVFAIVSGIVGGFIKLGFDLLTDSIKRSLADKRVAQ